MKTCKIIMEININQPKATTILKRITILFLIIIFAKNLNSQSFNLDDRSFGVIENDTIILGSGFVLDSINQVITCAHVIEFQTVIYYKTIKGDRYKLEIIKIDIINDIAYLRSDITICESPMIKSPKSNIEIGLDIVYLGYDWVDSRNNNNPTIKANRAKITAIGKQLNSLGIANFIEFVGDGKPGYSGGPVLNWNGEILGLMREAWFRKDLKVGYQTLINRAFLID